MAFVGTSSLRPQPPAAAVRYPNWMIMYGRYCKLFFGLLRVFILFGSFYFPTLLGDPIWAISSETISSLIGLSINFFFILPLLNSGRVLLYSAGLRKVVGIHLIEAPVLHPMSEGLFNFVIGWTFMFAPLLYSDKNRDRYKGSLDVLWGFQMFLTNTFLLPYMAIRLNKFPFYGQFMVAERFSTKTGVCSRLFWDREACLCLHLGHLPIFNFSAVADR